MPHRYLVLGASGLVGRRVVARLRHAGHEVRGATRRPQGPQEVRLDLLDPSTYDAALCGVSTVMLMSRPGDEDAHEHASGVIDAMERAGVARVVVLSAFGAERRPSFSLRRVERLVETSRLAWTHVRPNFFMQMLALPPLSTEIAARGTLSLPLGDAVVAYVDVDDVAAVLERALTDESLSGRALPVSGPEALSHRFIVNSIGASLGRDVRYVDLSADEAGKLLSARGFAPPTARRVLEFYELIRQGFCSRTDEQIADLLGRPLARWQDVQPSMLAAWEMP